MEKQEYREIYILIGVTVAVYLGFKYLLPLVAPFLFSWFLAWLLLPAVNFLKKLHITKGIGGSILIGILLAIVGVLLLGLGRLTLVQISKLIKNYPIYQQLFEVQTKEICQYCDELFRLEKGRTLVFVENGIEQAQSILRTKVFSGVSQQTVFGIGKIFSGVWVLFLIILGAFLIVKDSDDLKIIWEESLWYQKGKSIFTKLSETGLAYGKAQLLIIAVTFLICSIGIYLTGNPYSLLWGSVIAIFDALPMIGSGLILVPWSIIKVLKGQFFSGAILFSAFVICQIIRQLAESKIIGDRIGIKPIFTVIAMYAGLELFGIFGFILGPAALVIVKMSLQSLW